MRRIVHHGIDELVVRQVVTTLPQSDMNLWCLFGEAAEEVGLRDRRLVRRRGADALCIRVPG
jgi:hypothetical protein